MDNESESKFNVNTRWEDLNKGLILFLGFGSAQSPQQNKELLIQEFGHEKALSLAVDIGSILKEFDTFQVDWTSNTVESASEVVRTNMHTLYPELSDSALDALAWKFSFDWR